MLPNKRPHTEDISYSGLASQLDLRMAACYCLSRSLGLCSMSSKRTPSSKKITKIGSMAKTQLEDVGIQILVSWGMSHNAFQGTTKVWWNSFQSSSSVSASGNKAYRTVTYGVIYLDLLLFGHHQVLIISLLAYGVGHLERHGLHLLLRSLWLHGV